MMMLILLLKLLFVVVAFASNVATTDAHVVGHVHVVDAATSAANVSTPIAGVVDDIAFVGIKLN